MQTAIAVKDDEKVLKQSNELVDQANSLTIRTDKDLHEAVEMERTLKAFLEGPGTYHDSEIEMANALHKSLCGKRNSIVDGVKAAWKSLKDRRAKYQDEQQRKREEAQRAAEAEARRIESEKQAKIQAKIDEENRKIQEKKDEEVRIQREKDAQAKKIKDAEARKKFEAEEAQRRETQRKIDEEAQRKAAEKTSALEEKRESVYVAPKIVAPVSRPQGASISYTWDAVVENKSWVPDIYKTVDLAGLERDQKSRKGDLVVPGVRFTKRAVGATRGK